MCDISNIERNSATIKSLQESKGKITSVITSLAQDSCISLKHNKNAKKGENTWTGKIKKLRVLTYEVVKSMVLTLILVEVCNKFRKLAMLLL